MQRHAYLIMAHNEPVLLEKLLECLDDVRNDVFIHVDLRCTEIDELFFISKMKKSKLIFIERKKIFWGGYSIADCELRLLEAALPGLYNYYHYISGVDLPLKSQDELHAFFAKHDGKEFVSAGKVNTWKVKSRVMYYNTAKWPGIVSRRLVRASWLVFSALQKLLFINRIRKVKHDFYFGGAWFSITNNYAQLLIKEKSRIEKLFKHGYYVDEIFIGTMLMDSIYAKNISVLGNVRYIDWTRGKPYVWKENDFDEIMASPCLFARKFSTAQDSKIIDRICKTVLEG